VSINRKFAPNAITDFFKGKTDLNIFASMIIVVSELKYAQAAKMVL
jgi:hypothetical protein